MISPLKDWADLNKEETIVQFRLASLNLVDNTDQIRDRLRRPSKQNLQEIDEIEEEKNSSDSSSQNSRS